MKKIYILTVLLAISASVVNAQVSKFTRSIRTQANSNVATNNSTTSTDNFLPVKISNVLTLTSESFEGVTFPPAGWTKQNPDQGTGWSMDTVGTDFGGWTGPAMVTAPIGGGNHVDFATWNTGGPSSNDQWLITPQFSIAANDVLKFWTINPMSWNDTLQIWISTTTNALSSFTNLLTIPLNAANGDSIWVQKSINLNSYAGQQVYIGFREVVNDNIYDGGWVGIDLVQSVNSSSIIENYFINGIKLEQNQPNPFTGNTIIQYEIQNSASVTIDIYDITGRLALSYNEGNQTAGIHKILIDSEKLMEGTYFYTLKAGNNMLTKKMIITQ